MQEKNNDKVPLFKNWSGWYVFVILFLMLLIILFSFFTKRFS
jgi:Mg2+ and Co2+ transporter CorA